MLKDIIGKKNYQLKKITKKLESTESTRQTCDASYKTELTTYKTNYNKL
jgi:hypothetical protein